MNVKTRLDPEIHAAAKIAAAKEGISLTEYLRRLVQSDLERRSMNTRASSRGNRGDRNANSDSERIRWRGSHRSFPAVWGIPFYAIML